MFPKQLKKAVEVCVWADVVANIQGHKGVGKTSIVRQIGANWVDPYTKHKGLEVFVLYCATQEVTDLIGFPTKCWEKSGSPVIQGIPSKEEGDRVITSWAPPSWMTQLTQYCAQFEENDKKIRNKMEENPDTTPEDLWLFWNRPKAILFLDEVKRAQRDVIQALMPLVLSKTLFTHVLPRGTRIVTADNYAGLYDVREPDEAFMGRFCHLDLEPYFKDWYEWAKGEDVFPKVINFLTSNPTFLNQLPKNLQESTSDHKYTPLPDPRRWGDLINRVEKYGTKAVENIASGEAGLIIKMVIQGIVGIAAAEAYTGFSDTVVSLEDILKGKIKTSAALGRCKSETERNRLREKLQLEVSTVMKKRVFSAKEAANLNTFLVELDSKERAAAILQGLFIAKNNGDLSQQWVDTITNNKEVVKEIGHLLDTKQL